ncbi:CHASE2 domain-containing protein [Phormidium sp. FACHB-592]|uniref:CHASE2 domain-containing protein n=1 Tax=Stenomitos frigidus AS-A4 TaxID=2933935 RepID=A0ABV0KQ06_9CYAN|nr:CHASE2 domain-containing protein [Phormidium sp. FACHB-592]MBD2075399.1 CHASE2 domain-containing protein [Phormidium sp. FACHB-592]
MSQLVVLNLGRGDWSEGWTIVTAQLWLADRSMPMQMMGSLPPAPEFGALYLRWQQLYEALYAHRHWRRSRSSQEAEIEDDDLEAFEIEDDDTFITDVSEAEFERLCQELRQGLNHWLNADGFRTLDRLLRTHLLPDDEIRVIITAENPLVLRLPWHLWQFFGDYPKAEPALSLPDYTRSIKAQSTTHNQVRILAVLGSSQGIDVAHDRQLLEQLTDTELTLLVEPDLAMLNHHLWSKNWDILFFAGHSSSRGAGKIQINATQQLTIEQLKFALKKAIERGLQLAIFNSCDGLQLAWNLADLQIPQVMVMREPVPDRVAQEFLKQFLQAFSGGQSFYLAMREAREKLHALESNFPCATWLPVICQNPAELPPRWSDWLSQTVKIQPTATHQSTFKPQALKFKLSRVLLSSLVAAGCVLGLRSLGVLQPVELWAYDRLLQLRPHETPDTRLLLVTIDEADIQAQDATQRRSSLSDQALNQLLKKLEHDQARVIGIDIYRDFSASAQYPSLLAQLRRNKRLVAICKSRDAKFDPTGIAAPPEVPESRVGFSDFLEDNDGVLRRQLLFQTPDPASPCVAPYAFNTRLAFRYLEAKGVSPEFTPQGNLKLGKTIFHRLQKRMGGYQGIDVGGNQVLLNYRSLPSWRDIAPQVSLTQVLQGKIRREAIKDRLVLVGVTANSSSDVWSTPDGSGTADRMPGVIIQAHMTSQLISAVLDGRSLLGVWHWATESLWVGLWAIVGSICVSLRLSLLQRVAVCIAVIGALTTSCLFLLIQGLWVPLVPAGAAVLSTVGILSYINRKIDHTR